MDQQIGMGKMHAFSLYRVLYANFLHFRVSLSNACIFYAVRQYMQCLIHC